MTVQNVSLIYALLSMAATLGVIWFAVMAVASRFSEPAHDGLLRTRERLAPYALAGAWIVALLATLGSLYFSEIAHFEPCRLCWFQRIAMYPLVLILGIAAWRRDSGVHIYAVPLAIVGAAISGYHYLLEWFPSIDAGACTVGVPCTLVWFREFGFISLPYLALSAFLLVITLLLVPLGTQASATASTRMDEG